VIKKFLIVSILLVILLVIFGGDDSNTSTSLGENPNKSPSSDSSSSRCISVSGNAGIQSSAEGELSRNSVAVKSRDFEKLYFIKIEWVGNGSLEFGGSTGLIGEYGIWAVNDLSNPDFIFAVSSYAQEFSDWGSNTNMDISNLDDGYFEVKDCLS